MILMINPRGHVLSFRHSEGILAIEAYRDGYRALNGRTNDLLKKANESRGKSIFDRNATIEAFRCAVLDALDKTARELFNEKQGAIDQDLPALFRAIDGQVERLAQRFDIRWEQSAD